MGKMKAEYPNIQVKTFKRDYGCYEKANQELRTEMGCTKPIIKRDFRFTRCLYEKKLESGLNVRLSLFKRQFIIIKREDFYPLFFKIHLD